MTFRKKVGGLAGLLALGLGVGGCQDMSPETQGTVRRIFRGASVVGASAHPNSNWRASGQTGAVVFVPEESGQTVNNQLAGNGRANGLIQNNHLHIIKIKDNYILAVDKNGIEYINGSETNGMYMRAFKWENSDPFYSGRYYVAKPMNDGNIHKQGININFLE